MSLATTQCNSEKNSQDLYETFILDMKVILSIILSIYQPYLSLYHLTIDHSAFYLTLDALGSQSNTLLNKCSTNKCNTYLHS